MTPDAAPPATGTCLECGRAFRYRRRGIDPVTCSPDCQRARKSAQAGVRRRRWLERQIAAATAQGGR